MNIKKILMLIEGNDYGAIESEIVNASIYEKIILLIFLESKNKITSSVKQKIEGDYYKIRELNINILMVPVDKYEELIAHVVINIICGEYRPDLKDLRIMSGISIFAKNTERDLLFFMSMWILYYYRYKLSFWEGEIDFHSEYKDFFKIIERNRED